MKRLGFGLLALVVATPLFAQKWSVGAGTGPFVFGHFVERTIRLGNEGGPSSSTTSTLSGATRAGLVVDLERSLGERWAVRAEGTFSRSPLALKSSGDTGEFELEAGDLDVATFALPLIYRINRGGALRFHLSAGPANALYHVNTDAAQSRTTPPFRGTRSRWGLSTGIGASWRWTDRFSVEGGISDVVTASPFRRSDFIQSPGLDIRRPHNVHTSVGLRYRF